MLHIVTALPCEAKPIIRHYRLNGRQAENGFRIYENDQIGLIIAGIGKCAAAAACAYLQGAEPQSKHAWLNLGIAGHGDLNVGDAVMAHKVTDANTATSWYPAMPFKHPCPTVELVSVDQPQTDYDANIAYDMEASGFYDTASRFNSSELVQVVKLISDNHANPAEQVSAELTEQIIDAKLDKIDALIQKLLELEQQQSQQMSPEIKQFQQHWHFTVSQQHKLQRLLQRWQARSETTINPADFIDAKNSKAMLQALEKKIIALPMRFDDK